MRIVGFFLIFSLPLLALYNGNPVSPALMEEGFLLTKEGNVTASIGYRGDYCLDRRMKVSSKFSGSFERFSYSLQQGVVAVDLFERAEVYGSFGAIRIDAMQRPFEGFKNEYETGYRFTWGVGATVLIYQFDHAAIGIDGKYQWGLPNLDWIGVNGFAFGDLSGAEIRYTEWQIGLGLSYEIDFFTPYIALKYSNAKAEFSFVPPGLLPETKFDAKSRYPFGIALGATLTSKRFFSLNIEVRVIDEEALSLAGTIKL